MKWALIITTGLLLAGVAAFIIMAIQSQQPPATLGLQQGKLYPCPPSPNCLCSEAGNDPQHTTAPIPYTPERWQRLRTIITAHGGIIAQENAHYLHATFRSPLFHFVDDLELRLDPDAKLIHLRAASRVGHSDLGINRKRINAICTALDHTPR